MARKQNSEDRVRKRIRLLFPFFCFLTFFLAFVFSFPKPFTLYQKPNYFFYANHPSVLCPPSFSSSNCMAECAARRLRKSSRNEPMAAITPAVR